MNQLFKEAIKTQLMQAELLSTTIELLMLTEQKYELYESWKSLEENIAIGYQILVKEQYETIK